MIHAQNLQNSLTGCVAHSVLETRSFMLLKNIPTHLFLDRNHTFWNLPVNHICIACFVLKSKLWR